MRLRRVAVVVLAVAALSAALPLAVSMLRRPAPGLDEARAAHARASCVSRLLQDWSDGRIDGTYPIRCYRDTLSALPTDLQVYSSASEDIQRALSTRIRQSGQLRSLAGVPMG